MTTIALTTIIHAPAERCFDLSRSIDLHLRSIEQTQERAIAGTTTGLIGLHETVTWEAVHFGIRQQLTTRITEMSAPTYFCDEQLSGAFNSMRHEHYFEAMDGGTLMKDSFAYQTPYGPAGRLFDALVLRRYMTRFLQIRNRLIKELAEGDGWKQLLNKDQ